MCPYIFDVCCSKCHYHAGQQRTDGGARRSADTVHMPSGLIIEPGSTQSPWMWRRLWVADDCNAVLALSSEPEPLKFWLWASNALVVQPLLWFNASPERLSSLSCASSCKVMKKHRIWLQVPLDGLSRVPGSSVHHPRNIHGEPGTHVQQEELFCRWITSGLPETAGRFCIVVWSNDLTRQLA